MKNANSRDFVLDIFTIHDITRQLIKYLQIEQ